MPLLSHRDHLISAFRIRYTTMLLFHTKTIEIKLHLCHCRMSTHMTHDE